MSQLDANVYYVPHSSRWPIIAVIGMFLFMAGAAIWLNGYDGPGQIVLTIGALTIIGMMFGWFSNVIRESMKGIFNGQVDTLMAECEDYLDRRLNGELVPEPAAKRIR